MLDTGATNHMTGCRASLTRIDESVRGAVRFGDGSTVDICRIRAVTITSRNQDHQVLSKVYYIPSLKCNIVSLGQLEEGGCCVEIDKGVMEVLERQQTGSQNQCSDQGRTHEPPVHHEGEANIACMPTVEDG